MASVKLTKWDVAEALGLECVSTSFGRDDGENFYHDFEFNGKKFSIRENYYVNDQDTACEEAANQVLNVLGKMIAERMG